MTSTHDAYNPKFQNNIHFAHNYNGKMYGEYYTTIRLHNPARWIKNGKYTIFLGGIYQHEAQVKEILSFQLRDMSNMVAFIDCGRSAFAATKLIKTLYPLADFNQERMCLICLKKLI